MKPLLMFISICMILLYLPRVTSAEMTPDDWPMYMRNPQHDGFCSSQLEPPLSLTWTYETNGSICSSPSISDGKVYITSGDGYVYSLDAINGNLIWKYRIGIELKSSPAVAEGLVYIGSKNGTYALDAQTGQLVWKSRRPCMCGSSPTVFDRVLYLTSVYGPIIALDALDGSDRWTFSSFKTGDQKHVPAIVVYEYSSPTVAQHLVFTGTYTTLDNYIYALDSIDGEIVWKRETGKGNMGMSHSSASVVDNALYIGVGWYLYSLCASTGSLRWKFEAQDFIYSTPVVDTDTVYFSCWPGNIYALDARSGSQTWKTRIEQGTNPYLTLTQDTLYVGADNGYLYAFDKQSGKEKWRYEIGRAVKSPPSISQTRLFVGSTDGRVYAFISQQVSIQPEPLPEPEPEPSPREPENPSLPINFQPTIDLISISLVNISLLDISIVSISIVSVSVIAITLFWRRRH
jgi:outer membrane protein assembly factor BamB